jgi:hypothetical protein
MAYETIRLPANLDIQGNLTVRGTKTTTSRAELVQDNEAKYPIHPQLWRVWDAFGTALGSPGTDDLGITAGTWATGAPYLTAGDLKAAGATTRYARVIFQLPPEYVAGETILLSADAGMLTTVADTSCTLDFEVYKCDLDATIGGSDLCATSAQSINSLTFAEKTFTITATSLSAGDLLDIRMAVTCTDAATGTAVTPAVAHVKFKLDIKG